MENRVTIESYRAWKGDMEAKYGLIVYGRGAKSMNDLPAVTLRYDGKYDKEMFPLDGRSWTVRSHTVVNGRDLFGATFTGAVELLAVLRGAK